MKNLILLTAAILFTFGSAYSQARMVNKADFDKASMAAYEIHLDIAPDRVIDLWDEFWDDRYDVDVDREDRNRKREIYLAKEVTVESISEKQLDVYSAITTNEEERAKVSLGFGMGYDVYTSRENFGTVFAAAERILNEFEAYSYRVVYQEQVEAREKMLKEAVDEKEDLEKTIEKNNKAVERAQEKIADLEKEIEEARQEIEQAESNLKPASDKVIEAEKSLRDSRSKLTKWQ